MATCNKCASEISVDARRCPECNYEPATRGKLARTTLIIVGSLLTMTVIGAIVGIPMILAGLAIDRDANTKTASHA